MADRLEEVGTKKTLVDVESLKVNIDRYIDKDKFGCP